MMWYTATHSVVIVNLQGSLIIQAQMRCMAKREEQSAPVRCSARREESRSEENRDSYSDKLNKTNLLPALFDAGLPDRK